MMKKLICLAAALSFAFPANLSAHCQVPCGIFDDNNVISSMHTDYVTIEKAIVQINELSKDPAANAHQITRWVMNKESHAQDLQEKVLNYFLAQKVKLPVDDSEKELYAKKLALCHEVIVVAMKCKQSADVANAEKLHDLLHSFEELFGTKEKE